MKQFVEQNKAEPREGISRRAFLAAGSSAAVAAGSADLAGAAEEAKAAAGEAAKLAIHGGEKAVKAAPKLPIRWGAPERERLEAMLGQESLFYWKGPQTTLLAERFRAICPMEHVMTCSSGTAALHIAVAAAGVGPGDEVITAPVTDIGTVIGVIFQQGVPVFADLAPGSFNITPETVEPLITERTKAIIAVHLAGNPCDLAGLRALADKRGLALIEDCAQAWGAKYQGKPIGALGHIACWSLQDSKHITCGDGGVVASNDPKFGPALQRFGDKGFDRLKPGPFEFFGTNYRMSEPQAAVVAGQLTRLEEIAAARARFGDLFTDRIAGLPGIVPHEVRAGDRCVYWFYMFRVKPEALKCGRAEFVKALAAEGVQASAGYIPVPLYKNPVFLNHGFFAGRWPVKEMGLTKMDYAAVKCAEAEAILETGVRVTIHQAMDEAYIESAAAAVGKVARVYAA